MPSVLTPANAFPNLPFPQHGINITDQARSFNGTTDKIVCVRPTSAVNNFTTSFWVNVTASQADGDMFCYGDAAANGFRLLQELLVLHFVSTGNADVATSFTFTTSTWVNVIITSDGSNNCKVYANGSSVLSTNQSINAPSGADPLTIGAANVAGAFLNGSIADIAMWSTVLTAPQIASLAAGSRANSIGANANLIFYMPILGVSPETDLSPGGGHNGVLTGTTIVSGPPSLNSVLYSNTVQSFTYPGAVWPAVGTITPVTLDAVGTEKHTAAGTSATYTGITVGSGTNRALVVTIVWGAAVTANPTARSVIWDSGGSNQTMTEITFGANLVTAVGIYGLVAPVPGNKTLAASWTGSNESFIAGISFTGVNQTGGVASFFNATAVSNIKTVTVAGSPTDYAVCAFGGGGALGSPIGTVIYSDSVSGTFINAAAAYITGSSTEMMGTVGGAGSQPIVAATGVRSIISAGPLQYWWSNAFPDLAFPQHKSGQTTTVQDFLYPGAVQPQVNVAVSAFLAAWARGANRPVLGTGHV